MSRQKALTLSKTILPITLLLLICQTSVLSQSQWNIVDVDTPRSFHHSSIALDAENNPGIAYGGDRLYYAHWDPKTRSIQYETADDARGVGAYASLWFDAATRPNIAYYDAVNGDLKYAQRRGSVWHIETVDSTGNVGWHASLRMDPNNSWIISYYDVTNGDLKLARYERGLWNIETVDRTGDVGSYASLHFDSADFPMISYYDRTNADLKLARWDGSTWSHETVDSAGDVGRYSGVMLDDSDQPIIAYYDWTNRDLKIAQWQGASWRHEIVDETGDVGQHLSMSTYDSTKVPIISYYDRTNQNLKFAFQDSQVWTITTVDNDTDVGLYTSITAKGDESRAFICYYDNENSALKLAAFDKSLDTWFLETLDYSRDVGQYTSLVIDPAGNLFISYYDISGGDLKVASWDGLTWSLETVDDAGDVGMFASLALEPGGDPAVSYFDATNFDLKYTRWNGSSWDVHLVDDISDVGQYTSLAFDPSGNPTITYYDALLRNLKFAYWDGSMWTSDIVANAASLGTHTSLAYDSSGVAAISYYNWSQGDLEFLSDPMDQRVRQTVDAAGNVGWHTSLAFDPLGHPGISYYDLSNRELKVALFDGDHWSSEEIDRNSDVGAYSSLAINPVGYPSISYYDWFNYDLKFARWDGANWQVETVDTDGDVGAYTSLALDQMGNPIISYYDRTNGYLKLAIFPYLRFQAYVLESDRCTYSIPPGADGRINPGEDLDLRIRVTNISDFIDYRNVTGTIEPITPGVEPDVTAIDFGDVLPGQVLEHVGVPLNVRVPLWLSCSDEMLFLLTLSSNFGEFPPQYFRIPVDGNPTECKCEGILPDVVFDSLTLEDDRCPISSPPGGDGLVNPGEDVDLRVLIENTSATETYKEVTGTVEALTPGVMPDQITRTFPDISPGQVVQNLNRPLTFRVPLSLTCGDTLVFSLTISTKETGPMEPQFFTRTVDGDAGNCKCEESPPELISKTLHLEDDRCSANGPMAGDGLVNPGEEVDFRLAVENISESTDFHNVTAQVDVLTPGIVPASATLGFATVPSQALMQHSGDPLTLSLPLSLSCGDMIQLRITLDSDETGELPGEILNVPVDGNPANCYCTPAELFYDTYALERDYCSFTSPPGSDWLINPG
ncbi:hypothetical protein ACFLU6_09030, partial [Acidobacteriota bacterium]